MRNEFVYESGILSVMSENFIAVLPKSIDSFQIASIFDTSVYGKCIKKFFIDIDKDLSDQIKGVYYRIQNIYVSSNGGFDKILMWGIPFGPELIPLIRDETLVKYTFVLNNYTQNNIKNIVIRISNRI